MRQSVFAIAVLAAGLLSSAAQAQALQDRYGAPNAQAGASALRGSQTLLSWTGKVDPLRGSESGSGALRGPEMLDTSTGQAVRAANLGRLPSAPPARIASASPNPRLPTSIYDNGAVDSPPQAHPTQPVQSQPLAPTGPTAQADAAAQSQAGGDQTPRYYSLHREYGLTPDPTPAAQPSVLALSPTVATAMADNKDNSPTIDLAGEDQAAVAPPMRMRNPATGAIVNVAPSTSSKGTTTSTYSFNNP